MQAPRPPGGEGPTDPGADPGAVSRAPARRRESLRIQAPVVASVAVGGAAGASARYAASLLWPTAAGAFPWTTLVVNTVGCAVIGAFMVLITDIWAGHRLLRPFFGTGVLGGFTTFSTYAVDAQQLLTSGRVATAAAYLAATAAAAIMAVWAAAALTRRLAIRRTA